MGTGRLIRRLDTRRGWQGLMTLVFVLGVVWTNASRVPAVSDPAAAKPAPRPGFRAPEFTLTTLEGQPMTLSELRGQPVLINFWATWCPPCRAEMPHLQVAYEAHRDQGLVLLAVDQMESAQVVAAFREQYAIRSANALTFPILLDSDGSVSVQYRVRAIPTSFFVDRDGIIRDTFLGPMNRALIEGKLASILGEGG